MSATAMRNCDRCTLCCKVMAVTELKKPADTWCEHCDRGKGCGTYVSRPQSCRDFQCLYLLLPDVPADWKPDLCHMVLVSELNGLRVVVHCDPQRPDAWKREPHYSYLRRWATSRAAHDAQTVVLSRGRTIAILPDRDVDLG